MSGIFRSLTLCVFLFASLAATSVLAQQVKERQLTPAFDFTTVQMPVEIVSIKLSGKDVRPGEKIEGGDDWLKGLSFTLKNISGRPIAYVDIGLRFPQPRGFVTYSLHYGVDYSRGEPRRAYSPPAIRPGEIIELALTKEKYSTFQNILARGGASSSFDAAPYYVERVCFEDDPDVIWEGGYLKRRDPNQAAHFVVTERYVLSAEQQ